MKPKTMKLIGLISIVLGILICIPVTIEKNRTFTAYAVDGHPFTEFVHDQNDNSGYIFPCILGSVGFILFLVGYITSYTQKGAEENKSVKNIETTLSTPTPSIPSTPSTPMGVRNTFLTVICILTFIGSGWGILKSIRSYAMADTVATITGDALKNAETQMDQENTPSFAKAIMSSVTEGLSADNIRKTSILDLISNLLTLFGAILMWNLKKSGFYLYIAGIIVLIAAPIAMGRLVGIIGGAFVGFIGVIFIVMYGVNLKYMNGKSSANLSK